MNFSSVFRNIFGIPDIKPPTNAFDRNDDTVPNGNDFRNPIWNLDDDDDDDDFRNTPENNFSFQIFNDPLEMHRFFEHQMGEILKSFQNQFIDLSPYFGGVLDGQGFPALGPPNDVPNTGECTPGSLRDKYLKPGYKSIPDQTEPWFFGDKNTDTDLDERIKSGGLDSVFKDKSHDSSMVPIPERGIEVKVFGRSVVTQTVRRSDGTVEHHQTIRDNQGNKETTVTRQVGDQSYSVITKLNPTGVEERVENFVNIDKGNLSEFEKKWKSGADSGETTKRNLFPWDKFFPTH